MERLDVKNFRLSPVLPGTKTTNRNPRSTVGTTTEIYDFLRLLYARIGKPILTTPVKNGALFEEQIIEDILKKFNERFPF